MDRGEYMNKQALQPPNYTQVPNAIFAIMPDMDKSELKVILAVCRQTFGWHKTKDRLTITRLMELTGLSRQSVYDGINAAKERGLLIQEETDELGYVYSLDIKPDMSNQETPPVNPLDTESVQPVDTQKKEYQNKPSKEIVPPTATTEKDYRPFYHLYESLGLFLNATTAQLIREMADDYDQAWIEEAFRRAAAANKRNLNYINGILRNWSAAGGIDDPHRQAIPAPNGKGNGNGRGGSPPNHGLNWGIAGDVEAVYKEWQMINGEWYPPDKTWVSYHKMEGEIFPDALARLRRELRSVLPSNIPRGTR